MHVLPFRAHGFLMHESSVGSEPREDTPINKTAPLTCHVHSAAGWARDPGHLRSWRWGWGLSFPPDPREQLSRIFLACLESQTFKDVMPAMGWGWRAGERNKGRLRGFTPRDLNGVPLLASREIRPFHKYFFDSLSYARHSPRGWGLHDEWS